MASNLKARPLDAILADLTKVGFGPVTIRAIQDVIIRSDKTLTDTGGLTAKTPLPGAVDASGNLLLKNVVQAVGAGANPTTNSNVFSVIPQMTQTFTTKGNKVLVIFSGVFQESGAAPSLAVCQFQLFRDGVAIGPQYEEDIPTGDLNLNFTVTMTFLDVPPAGQHTYDVRWAFVGGAAAVLLAFSTARNLQVVELG